MEVRGIVNGRREELVLGCAERPAVATAAVAALAAVEICGSRSNPARTGSAGLAEWVDPLQFLKGIRTLGLRPERFIGVEHASQ